MWVARNDFFTTLLYLSSADFIGQYVVSFSPLSYLCSSISVKHLNLITWGSQREPKVKDNPRHFFCLHSQIAVWTLKRMHAFLLSLRLRVITEHAQTHMVKKWWIYIKRRPWKEARILWFLLRSSHIQMHALIGEDPHWTFMSVLCKGRLADFTRDQFTSEHFWVNLSRTSRTRLYQMPGVKLTPEIYNA